MICPECDGVGFVYGGLKKGDHGKPPRLECITCDGSGRVERETGSV